MRPVEQARKTGKKLRIVWRAYRRSARKIEAAGEHKAERKVAAFSRKAK